MDVYDLMGEMNLSYPEAIEMIKLQGEVVETDESIFGITQNKFVERAIIIYRNYYWTVFSICDDYAEIFYYEEVKSFNSLNSAENYYYNLTNTLT
jgi:hypothetical protein